MPAIPSSVIEPLWAEFAALIPARVETHPLGCHRPRIDDRIVFDKLVQALTFGAGYARIADGTCSATTIRARRDEWIAAGIFDALEQACLEAYDRMIGLDLGNLAVDGCIVKAPCGGEAAGRSPVDRGKLGTKRSLLVECGHGIPLGCVIAGANRNDSPLLAPTLEKLGRFGFRLPEQITVHLDAGYDSGKTRELLTVLGCHWEISTKGVPLQVGQRWPVERTNSWHTRGFGNCRSAPNDDPASSRPSSPSPTRSSSPATSSTKPGPATAGKVAPHDNPDLSAQPLRATGRDA